MEGKIKKIKDTNNDNIYPITVAEALYINPTTNLSEYLNEKTLNSEILNKISETDGILHYDGTPVGNNNSLMVGNTYIIELSRWGITTGIPAKPWVSANYIMADNNITGFTNAIRWAADKGYTNIVVPKNSYALCYPNTIIIDRSYVTLDLNGSTFKVIYNSDSKSPLDTRTGTDYWELQGQCFAFSNAHHSKLINGIIYGERLERSFANPLEVAIEWTTGVHFRKGSSYCTVSNNEIAYFMADSISMQASSMGEYVEFGLTLTVNDIDKSTGLPIAATGKTIISQMLPIPSNGNEQPYNVFSISGQGVTRQTGLISKDVGVFYYRADNSFVGHIYNQKIYTPMTIPSGATKYRFIFYNETDTSRTSSNQLSIHLKFGLNPHHNIVINNEVYGNHRGGIQPGGSENVIAYNIIHDIGFAGQPGNVDLYGKPIFNDPTRYGINQEDFYGDAVHIHNNLIYGCYAGILCGSYSALINNNRVYNCGSVGINIYTTYKTTVKDNFVYKCGIGAIGLMSSHFAMAHVEICGNTIIGTTGDWVGSGYHVNIHDNFIVDATNVIAASNDTHTFKNNHFKWNSSHVSTPVITMNRMDGCSFQFLGTTNKLPLTLNSYNLTNCVFENLEMKVSGRNQSSQRETVLVNDCRFKNSIIEARYSLKQVTINIEKSKIFDTILRVGNLNGVGEHPTITVKGSDIAIETGTHLIEPLINKPSAYGIVRVIGSSVKINNTSFLYLIKNGYTTAPKTSEVYFKECDFSFTGPNPLNLIYYSHVNTMRKFHSINNRYTNITLPTEDANVFIGFDVSSQSKNVDPSYGYFNVGQIVENISPGSGEYAFRICTTQGWGCSTTWEASKIVEIEDQIYIGNKVYQSITSEGKSLKIIPTEFPQSVGDKITESGLPHWVGSNSYVVGDQVIPSTPNGLFYQCVDSAGVSSNTEPMWTTQSMNYIYDGTVRWISYRLVTWENIGNKAEFKRCGLIE